MEGFPDLTFPVHLGLLVDDDGLLPVFQMIEICVLENSPNKMGQFAGKSVP
jgi:hypothetical protein